MSSDLVFPLIALLLAKHFVIDWVVQTDNMAQNKGDNLRLLVLHTIQHAAATFFIVIWFSGWEKALIASTCEVIIHSLIDFLKANESFLGRFHTPSKPFFIFLGLDQLLHQLTYLIMVWYLLS